MGIHAAKPAAGQPQPAHPHPSIRDGLAVEPAGLDREIERLHPRTKDIQPSGAAHPPGRRVHVDQINLVDPKLIALKPVSQTICRNAHQSHDERKRHPRPLHAADDFAEKEIVGRSDQKDVPDNQARNKPERHELDPGESVQALRIWPAISL